MKRLFSGILIAFFALSSMAITAIAGTQKSLKRSGWITYETNIPYSELYPKLKLALEASPLRQITTASASAGAKGRGITIPGNRVVGVYNNFFALRMLEASIAAGMEAPLRFYLTERSDGGSNLTYAIPTETFRPYFEDGGKDLMSMARELDGLMDEVAKATVKE